MLSISIADSYRLLTASKRNIGSNKTATILSHREREREREREHGRENYIKHGLCLHIRLWHMGTLPMFRNNDVSHVPLSTNDYNTYKLHYYVNDLIYLKNEKYPFEFVIAVLQFLFYFFISYHSLSQSCGTKDWMIALSTSKCFNKKN